MRVLELIFLPWRRAVRLEKALRDIAEFGFKNSGCGYSCAKMARAALKEEAERG